MGMEARLGLVLSIYIHEMGHVIALRRYGFKACAGCLFPKLRVDSTEDRGST